MKLSESLVFQVLQSGQDFPIDFDDAWRWIGWNKKQDGRDVLFHNCEENIDFLRKGVKSSTGGRPSEWIVITVECFKSLAMAANTSVGKKVRRYFLDCEKELKRRIAEEQQRHKQRIIKAVVDEEHTRWEKRFEDQFFDEAYRVTGWRKAISGHPPCMGNFIKQNVYEFFPEGTSEELGRVNPSLDGKRKRKHHQHLQPLGLNILDSQKTAVLAVMRLSPDNNSIRFKHNLQKALGNSIQLELPFFDDSSETVQ